MTDDREDFKERLAECLEITFEDLKNSSKTLADYCVLPTANMIIKINPVAQEAIPTIEVNYEFAPSNEALNALFNKED